MCSICVVRFLGSPSSSSTLMCSSVLVLSSSQMHCSTPVRILVHWRECTVTSTRFAACYLYSSNTHSTWIAYEASAHDQGFKAPDLLAVQHRPYCQGSWLWILGSRLACVVILHVWNHSSVGKMDRLWYLLFLVKCLTGVYTGCVICLLDSSRVGTIKWLLRRLQSRVLNLTTISGYVRPSCTTS